MQLTQEVYAEDRGSFQESRLPPVVQRIRAGQAAHISEPKRFLILVFGVFSCICTSTTYVYNLFSGKLQAKYNFTQSDMSTITTLAGILGIVALPLGGLYDTFGPRPLFLIGMAAFPLGAVAFGLAFADAFNGSVFIFTLLNALLGIATSLFDIAGLMTVLSIFPSSRGAVIAVMKTFVGLGSAVFGAIQLGFFENDVSYFFYFMAMFVSVVGLLCVLFVTLPPYQLTTYEEKHLSEEEKRLRLSTKRAYFEQVPPMRRFVIALVLVSLLVVFLPVQGVAVTYGSLSSSYKRVFAVITVAILLLFPVIALPIPWLDGRGSSIFCNSDNHVGDGENNSGGVLGGARDEGLETEVAAMPANTTRRSIVEDAIFTVPEVNEAEFVAPQFQTRFTESAQTIELWAFAYSMFTVAGAEMVVMTNARFIYGAAANEEVTPELTTLLTVLIGVGSALGRILMSIFEVWSQKRKPEDRIGITAALFLPSTLTFLTCALLPIVPKQLMLLPFALVAVANGFTAATVVLVMRTMYAKDIGMHYNFTSLAFIFSSIVFNKYLYGGWYSYEAQRQGGNLCYGTACILVPFVVMGALVLSGLVANYILHVRYRSFCQRVIRGEGDASSPPSESHLSNAPLLHHDN